MSHPQHDDKTEATAPERSVAAVPKKKWYLKDRRDPMRVLFMGSYMSRAMDVLDCYDSLSKTVFVPVLGKYFFKPIINLYGAQYHSGRATPLRDVIPIVRQAKSVAVSECACRVRLNKCSHSTRTCLKINTGAEVELEKGDLKSECITTDEAVRIVEQAYKDGLMLSVEWCIEPFTYSICCCCDCCCVSRKLRFERGIESAVMCSEYLATFKTDLCADCGKCEELCPGKAISIVDGVRRADEKKCVGCGLCEYHCPAGAIELVEVREAKEPEDNNIFHYFLIYISVLLVFVPHFVIHMLVKGHKCERAREIEW